MRYRVDGALDEPELFKRIVQGDMLAFEVFYKDYYPRLFRFILKMTHNPELVEEVIQETLSVVWEKPDGFNYDSKLSTWVFGIAYHKAMKAISKDTRHGTAIDVDDLEETLGDPAPNQSDIYEKQDWLNAALNSLSAEQRSVIELTFYYDLPYEDIAKILGCPENTVKTRMFHARKKLQVFAESQAH